jgi:hypothetical protein
MCLAQDRSSGDLYYWGQSSFQKLSLCFLCTSCSPINGNLSENMKTRVTTEILEEEWLFTLGLTE